MQAATLKIVVGSHIWLPDKDLAWIDGEVFRIEGRNAHVRTTNGKTVCVADVSYHLFCFWNLPASVMIYILLLVLFMGYYPSSFFIKKLSQL